MTDDEKRELQKVYDTLDDVDKYFQHQTNMNAQLHLSTPRPSPLAAKVTEARYTLDRVIG